VVDLLRPDRGRIGCRSTGRVAAGDHRLVGDRSGRASHIHSDGEVGIDVVGCKRVGTSAGERTEGACPPGPADISGGEAGWHGVGDGDATGSGAPSRVRDLNCIFIADLAWWEVADVRKGYGEHRRRWRWSGAASAASEDHCEAND
jgi:hypothetical protein